MYGNFGIPGFILGMAIIGALLAFLVRAFNNPAMSPLEFVTGTAVIYWLAYRMVNSRPSAWRQGIVAQSPI